MPQYVLLHHDTPPDYERPSHWDLMFEVGGMLRTWAVPVRPDRDPRQEVEQLADHRREYLTYEGPVSENRGSVTREDAGSYEVVEGDIEGKRDGRLVLKLRGEVLSGRVELTPVARDYVDQEAAAPQRWALSWSAD